MVKKKKNVKPFNLENMQAKDFSLFSVSSTTSFI